jgi:Neuraminidase (sialidase)
MRNSRVWLSTGWGPVRSLGFCLVAVGIAAAAISVERVVVMDHGGYFPVAIRLTSGEILAVMRGGAPHIGRAGCLDMSISGDQGKTWAKPWTAADGPEDDRNPALGQLADGTILLAYAVLSGYDASGLKFADPRRDMDFDGVYLQRSRDKGKTWSKPERSEAIHSFYAGHGSVSPYGKISRLADGTVIMAVYFGFSDDRGHESYIFRSKDGGRTWGDPSLLGKHYNETAVVDLGGGRLLAAMRSEKGGHIAVTRSEDRGYAWSEPVQVTKDLEHPADLARLENGWVLMTYGERNPLRGARAVLSRDGGKTWDTGATIVIADDAPNTDCGYPSSVEMAKGKVVTLYYQVDDLETAPASAKCTAALWKIGE